MISELLRYWCFEISALNLVNIWNLFSNFHQFFTLTIDKIVTNVNKTYWGATCYLIFFFLKQKRIEDPSFNTRVSNKIYDTKIENIGTWLHLWHVLCHWLTVRCPICFWNKGELNTPISALEPPIQYKILKLKNMGTWLHLLLLQRSKKANYQNWN